MAALIEELRPYHPEQIRWVIIEVNVTTVTLLHWPILSAVSALFRGKESNCRFKIWC
jgi:hypothetical protein